MGSTTNNNKNSNNNREWQPQSMCSYDFCPLRLMAMCAGNSSAAKKEMEQRECRVRTCLKVKSRQTDEYPGQNAS